MRRLIFLFITVCSVATIYANDTTAMQPERFYHYIDIHGVGGVSSLQYALGGGETQITPSFSAGVGYTWFFHYSVGLQLGVHLTRVATKSILSEPMEWKGQTDYMGDVFDHRLRFNDWSETQQSYLLEVPLGFRFRYRKDDKVVGLHAAFGAKLAIPVMSYYTNSGSLTHTAWYDLWQLELHDLPGRFETEQFNPKERTDIDSKLQKWNAEAYAELGINIRLNSRADLLLAAYGQYMITNLSSTADDARTQLGFASDHNNAAAYMPVYEGLIGTDRVGSIHPWMAGLKLGISIYPGTTREQRERQMRRLAEEFPHLMPHHRDTMVTYDTVWMRDTMHIEHIIYRVDTIRSAGVSRGVERPTREERMLEDLLSKAVIWFHFDKYSPILEPAYILDSVAAMMTRYPDLRINVNGHACIIGTDSYNQRLAMRRAQAVANLLEKKGIAANRMKVVSYGASHPYRYNSTHHLSRDRRVEVVPEGYELLPEDQRHIELNSQTTDSRQDSIVNDYTLFLGEEHIRPGSRLAQIARRWYKEPEYWVYIYEANMDKITNPEHVPVGLLVMIPDLEKTIHAGKSHQEALRDARDRAKKYKK